MATMAKSTMLLAQHQEQLIFIDIFGTRRDVYLNVTAGPDRATKIASVIAEMQAVETSITTYAAANGHDLTAQLAAGAAILAALQGS